MITIADIRERLTEIRSPNFSQDIVALGAVRAVLFEQGIVTIQLLPPAMPQASLNVTINDIRRAIGAFEGVREVRVHVDRPGAQPAQDSGPVPLPGIRDIVAVSSTKGGVGKSTIATNLAVACAKLGLRVGLMDADVYGPSLPTMLGLSGRPSVGDDKRIAPLEKHGLRLMSIGFFLDDNSPVIWRGPLVMGLVRQFLKDVDWGELDLLLIDMPPGTGDAQLTLVQQVPLTGAVIVTTPQDVATLDVERGVAMFRHVNIPVLGVVENMSVFQCPSCGQQQDIFGHGGAERISQNFGVPVLARLPLAEPVRAGGDRGMPIVAAEPDHPISQQLIAVARELIAATAREHELSAPPTIIG
ncbi:MAG TPA: Mrp/NBP35 family ATP-binding protein [Terriglobales bacterium]|nr:Mrp/NBP35 family ATP-binding protein [Terriglobales bacterium]